MDAKTWNIHIKDRFFNLESFTRKQVDRRNKLRERRLELQKQASSGDYSNEYMERLFAQLDREQAENAEAAYAEALEHIGKLVETMQSRYAEPLDLADPALSNALNIITLTGGNIEHAELVKLVDTFTGSPAALKTLRSVFERQDMGAGVELVNQRLYEPAFVAQRLAETAEQAFRQSGSLNGWASEVNKYAQREGLTFPKDGGTIDPAGAYAAMRRGAGLPEFEPA